MRKVRNAEGAEAGVERGRCGMWKVWNAEGAERGRCGTQKTQNARNAEGSKCGSRVSMRQVRLAHPQLTGLQTAKAVIGGFPCTFPGARGAGSRVRPLGTSALVVGEGGSYLLPSVWAITVAQTEWHPHWRLGCAQGGQGLSTHRLDRRSYRRSAHSTPAVRPPTGEGAAHLPKRV